jgi:hypothetical protein
MKLLSKLILITFLINLIGNQLIRGQDDDDIILEEAIFGTNNVDINTDSEPDEETIENNDVTKVVDKEPKDDVKKFEDDLPDSEGLPKEEIINYRAENIVKKNEFL